MNKGPGTREMGLEADEDAADYKQQGQCDVDTGETNHFLGCIV